MVQLLVGRRNIQTVFDEILMHSCWELRLRSVKVDVFCSLFIICFVDSFPKPIGHGFDRSSTLKNACVKMKTMPKRLCVT